MLVCSLPRCGATKYCLDLQERTGLKFAGELNPIHIGDDRKSLVHETRYQPIYTNSDFAELLHDHSNHIVLVNQGSYLLINQADVIVLRKDMRDAALSLAKFLIMMYPQIKPSAIIHQLKLMHYDYIGMMSYLNKYSKDIIWYEDYYNMTGTDTSLLESYPGKDNIMREIDAYYR